MECRSGGGGRESGRVESRQWKVKKGRERVEVNVRRGKDGKKGRENREEKRYTIKGMEERKRGKK